LLLAPLLGGGVVTIAAIAMRLWITLGELLAAGASLLFLREKNLPSVPPAMPPAVPPAMVDSPRGAVQ
jgi:hypothetical protein